MSSLQCADIALVWYKDYQLKLNATTIIYSAICIGNPFKTLIAFQLRCRCQFLLRLSMAVNVFVYHGVSVVFVTAWLLGSSPRDCTRRCGGYSGRKRHSMQVFRCIIVTSPFWVKNLGKMFYCKYYEIVQFMHDKVTSP
jgi:hypothetical protein